MTILTALQSATIRLVGQRPSVFFGSTNQTEIELCDLINEVAADIVSAAEWQALTNIHTITGDGATDVFPLPDDYESQLQRSDLQDLPSWAWGYAHITDINDFLFQKARNFLPVPGGWIIYQDKFHFAPAPTGTATFPYTSKNYAVDAASLQPKAQFDADTDTFVLPERLLTLGLVWKWREQKKLDFTGDQESYELALSQYATKDKGSRVYRSGRRAFTRNTRLAWPWQLGPA